MLEKNGQELHVTVWATDSQLLQNIGKSSLCDFFPSCDYIFQVGSFSVINFNYCHYSIKYFTQKMEWRSVFMTQKYRKMK